MATETLSFDILAKDLASSSFKDMARNAGVASGSLGKLSDKLSDVSGRVAKARVELDGDKQAGAELDKLGAKIIQLSGREIDPEVNLQGYLRTRAQIASLDLAMDRLDGKTAEVKVDVDRGGSLAKLGATLGGLAGAGAGGLPILGALGTNPWVAIGAIVAGLAALPFAAAAAAGGIVTALGGGLAAVGVIAAAKTKQVKAAFADLKTDAGKQLAGIGQPFEKALLSIIGTTDRLLPKIIAPFKDALKAIAPSFESFGKTLVTSFASPAVGGAVRELGKAFGAVLDALRPELPVIVSKIAGGIRGIASAIHDHPQLFADFVNFILQTTGAVLAMIGGLTRAAANIVVFVKLLVHWTSVGAKYVRDSWIATGHLVEHIWDMLVRGAQATWNAIWRNTVSRIANGVRDAIRWFRNLFSTVAGAAATFRNNIGNTWDTIWRNTVTRVRNGISDVIGWFRTLPGRAIGALWGLGSHMYSFARAALGDFLRGLKSIAGSVFSWVGNFVRNIWNKVKGFFNMSPPHPGSKFFDLGRDLMLHLSAGIKAHAHRAQNAFGGAVNFKPGLGVQQWGPLVRRALVMEHLNPLLAARVMYQMQTESGGNPNAINLTDSNAAAGTPSKGLMQVIGPTFSSYHWPGTSWNIYNPLANIAAALNYARHRYGPTLMSGGMGIGSGHGYAFGTGSAAKGWAWVGERGPELVNFRGGEQVYPAQARVRGGAGGTTIVVRVDPGIAAVTPDRRLGQHIAQQILMHTKGGGRLYPAGVAPK